MKIRTSELNRSAKFGCILVWAGSLIWCWEVLAKAWPTGWYFVFIPAGMPIVTKSAMNIASWKPVVVALTAGVPALVTLCVVKFRI